MYKIILVQVFIIIILICPFRSLSSTPEKGYAAGYSSREASGIDIMQGWYLDRIKAPQAGEMFTGGASVLVAVLDTGIEQDHEEIVGRIVDSANFTTSQTTDDLYGHGTCTAGAIIAVVESAGFHASLLNVKVARDDGSCNSTAVAQGIIWAVKRGAKVINLGLAINKPSPELEEAVEYAWANGAVLVAAAGNNASSKPVYPAAYTDVIGVAATDNQDHLPSWSNRGNWISVGAPGVGIYSTLPDNKYGYQSGTSMATALVSGEAALLYSLYTSYTEGINERVVHAIETGCDDVETDIIDGRINVVKAVITTDDYEFDYEFDYGFY